MMKSADHFVDIKPRGKSPFMWICLALAILLILQTGFLTWLWCTNRIHLNAENSYQLEERDLSASYDYGSGSFEMTRTKRAEKDVPLVVGGGNCRRIVTIDCSGLYE
ncbi:uncharacterized protein [Watersipora subatra]|uniref:uncharacterized protein isoform X2 n=1 Tax=Watersipora subatra TaxID=2589382 RepID=UPI00355B266D